MSLPRLFVSLFFSQNAALFKTRLFHPGAYEDERGILYAPNSRCPFIFVMPQQGACRNEKPAEKNSTPKIVIPAPNNRLHTASSSLGNSAITK
jgi:hypothetical protein